MSETVQVAIGTEPGQYVPQKVLEYSIRKHTPGPLDIRFLTPETRRVGGTRFGFARFEVPRCFGYRGRAIYLDADQIVLADLRELIACLDSQHAIGLVREVEGTFAGAAVAPRNETSVMVLDCAKLEHWDPDRLFERVVPNRHDPGKGQIVYRDFMRLAWEDPARIQSIDPRWNHYNLVRVDTRLVHFSHVREQPWRNRRHALAEFWERWMLEAKQHGYVRRADLWRAVARLHIHPHFLREALRAS